jgi:hypothetical protein
MRAQVHDENKDTGYLVVTGKHKEKADEHGFVSRSFTRRYALSKDVDMTALQCNVSNKGQSPVRTVGKQSICRHHDAASAAQAV